jgi:2-iminobutanoate/2-iminopropanoate deaminase
MTKRDALGLTVLSAFIVLCLAACQQAPVVETPPPGPPFSQSIEVDDTLYLSGQVGLDPETRELASGIEAETKVTMKNLKRELEAKGYGFSDVVASHVWMTNLSQIGQMSEVYRSFFEEGKLPTRTTVGISKLAVGASVEIAMVAVRGDKKYIYPEGAEPGKAPYSPGVLAGDRLFVSGQAGVVPGTLKLVEGDFKAHVKQTLKNIESVLKAAEMDFSNVVSTEVFMTSGEYFGPMSEVYVSMVPDPKPARVPILVSSIPLDSPVEITMIASREEKTPVLPEGMGPSGAYSRGLKVGNTMYIAGVFSAKETVEERVSDCLDRVKQIYEAGGFSLSDVVEARVYLKDLADYDGMNAAYRDYFPDKPPTRATMEVPDSPGTTKIGMAFVAAQPTSTR